MPDLGYAAQRTCLLLYRRRYLVSSSLSEAGLRPRNSAIRFERGDATLQCFKGRVGTGLSFLAFGRRCRRATLSGRGFVGIAAKPKLASKKKSTELEVCVGVDGA